MVYSMLLSYCHFVVFLNRLDMALDGHSHLNLRENTFYVIALYEDVNGQKTVEIP